MSIDLTDKPLCEYFVNYFVDIILDIVPPINNYSLRYHLALRCSLPEVRAENHGFQTREKISEFIRMKSHSLFEEKRNSCCGEAFKSPSIRKRPPFIDRTS